MVFESDLYLCLNILEVSDWCSCLRELLLTTNFIYFYGFCSDFLHPYLQIRRENNIYLENQLIIFTA